MAEVQKEITCKLQQIECVGNVKVRNHEDQCFWAKLEAFTVSAVDRKEIAEKLKSKVIRFYEADISVWACYDYGARICVDVFWFYENELAS